MSDEVHPLRGSGEPDRGRGDDEGPSEADTTVPKAEEDLSSDDNTSPFQTLNGPGCVLRAEPDEAQSRLRARVSAQTPEDWAGGPGERFQRGLEELTPKEEVYFAQEAVKHQDSLNWQRVPIQEQDAALADFAREEADNVRAELEARRSDDHKGQEQGPAQPRPARRTLQEVMAALEGLCVTVAQGGSGSPIINITLNVFESDVAFYQGDRVGKKVLREEVRTSISGSDNVQVGVGAEIAQVSRDALGRHEGRNSEAKAALNAVRRAIEQSELEAGRRDGALRSVTLLLAELEKHPAARGAGVSNTCFSELSTAVSPSRELSALVSSFKPCLGPLLGVAG